MKIPLLCRAQSLPTASGTRGVRRGFGWRQENAHLDFTGPHLWPQFGELSSTPPDWPLLLHSLVCQTPSDVHSAGAMSWSWYAETQKEPKERGFGASPGRAWSWQQSPAGHSCAGRSLSVSPGDSHPEGSPSSTLLASSETSQLNPRVTPDGTPHGTPYVTPYSTGSSQPWGGAGIKG